MIITLSELKLYLRLETDYTEDDAFLNTLISAAEAYLKNSTGKIFTNTNGQAKLFCLVLISDWYENRSMNSKASEKVRFTINSILAQLEYCDGVII